MKKITISPSTKIFDDFANSGCTFEQAVYEFVDNSIASMIGSECNVEIEIRGEWNLKNKCLNKQGACLIIKDDSSGIKREELGNALSPAANANKQCNSLHEHGTGMKTALRALGTTYKDENIGVCGFELFTKHQDEQMITKITNIAFGDIPYEEMEDKTMFPKNHGTLIKIEHLTNSVPSRKEVYSRFTHNLGHRYQRHLRGTHQKKLSLILKLSDKSGNVIKDSLGKEHSFQIADTEPLFKDGAPLVNCSLTNRGNSWQAHLIFGWAYTDEEFNLLPDDSVARNQNNPQHPYFPRNTKIDLVYNDVVLTQVDYTWINKDKQLSSIDRDWRGYRPRMIIVLERGFKTTTKKDNIIDTEEVQELKNEVWKHIKKYANSDKKATKDNETEYKNELAKRLDNYCSNIKREPSSLYGLRADFFLERKNNPEIWEIKIDEGTTSDIFQLMGYLAVHSVKNGVLVANGFNDNAKSLCLDINAGKLPTYTGYTIELKDKGSV